MPLQMDVTHLDQITSAIDAVVARFGRLDILVNNAGGGWNNLAEDVSEERIRPNHRLKRQVHFLCLPGGRTRHATPKGRVHHQYEFAGGIRGLAHGIGLLPEQSRHRPPHEMPGRRMGQGTTSG